MTWCLMFFPFGTETGMPLLIVNHDLSSWFWEKSRMKQAVAWSTFNALKMWDSGTDYNEQIPPFETWRLLSPLHDITLCHHRHLHLKWSSTKRASTFIAISLPFSNIGRHCNCLWCDPPYSTPQPLTARRRPCLPLLGFLNSFIGILVQPMVSLGTIQRTYISKHII